MNKCKYGDYRSFVHCGEAYYAKKLRISPGTVDEVFFGLSCGGGGTHGEMKMVWKQLGDKACPSLHVFDDGWEVLASWTDVITALGENGCEVMSQHSITPKGFVQSLQV